MKCEKQTYLESASPGFEPSGAYGAGGAGPHLICSGSSQCPVVAEGQTAYMLAPASTALALEPPSWGGFVARGAGSAALAVES